LPQQWWRSAATIARATKSTVQADAVFIIKYDYYKDCADKLRAYRRKHWLTQQQLGDLLGVTYPTVAKWEKGRCKPSYGYWERFRELVENSNISEIQSKTDNIRE
jgi:DNA-binding transcriptional regulator YiaG